MCCIVAPDCECCLKKLMVSSLVQVVVFALGIGTTMNHAEKLITAFQDLHQKCRDATASAHQLASERPPSLSQGGSLQAGDDDSIQPSVDAGKSMQLMSLRDAFFAKSVR